MKSIIQSHHGLKALTTGIASILLAWASVHPATAQIHNTTNGPNAVITNGIGAGASMTTGHDNSAYGFDALNLTTTGIANTALGSVALKSNTTGGFNTAVGYGTLNRNSTLYSAGASAGIGGSYLVIVEMTTVCIPATADTYQSHIGAVVTTNLGPPSCRSRPARRWSSTAPSSKRFVAR